ncbi:MAG: response regulator [Calditrichaeota bacterium]|nr:response regulator [Calditrichota bacterium]
MDNIAMDTGDRKTILIIEDDISIVKLLSHRLKKLGYDVMYANNGYQGLRLAQTQRPDLIILDVLLPKMNGFKVCRLLKFDEKFQNIPVIMLTSRETESHMEMGRASGADEYVLKTDRRGTLLKAIQKYLETENAQVSDEA